MSVIGQSEGTHPLFVGMGEPVDVDAAENPWKVIAEANPRKALLRRDFGSGRVVTFRVDAGAAPVKQGNRATFASHGGQASWETFDSHVKLVIDGWTEPPPTAAMTVATTSSGCSFETDGEGGLRIVDGTELLGRVVAPWLEFTPDDAVPDEPGGAPRERRTLAWSLTGNTLSVDWPTDLSVAEWQSAVFDPTVINTSTASTATAYSNQRKTDRCQNGVRWSMFWDGTSTTTASMRFAYSTDDGATWTDSSSNAFGFSGTGTTYTPNGSLFIDLDDYAHVAYRDRVNGYIYYRRGTPNAGRTAWTWSAATVLFSTTTGYDYPDVIAHREGTGWKAHAVVRGNFSTAATVRVWTLDITSGGTISTDGVASLGNGTSAAAVAGVSIDFNHTGDSKTVSGGTPHLYVAYSYNTTGAGKGIRFRKATYSGGTWTWGTEREIDSTRYVLNSAFWVNCLFDGTRVIIGGEVYDGSAADLVLHERDAADTTTTTRVLVDNVADAARMQEGSLTYDGVGNVYLFGRLFTGSVSQLHYRKWTRSGASLGSSVVVDAATGNANLFASTKRGYSDGRIEFIYTDGTSSPYDVTYGSISLFTAATLGYYDGAAWVDKPLSYYDGTDWVALAAEKLKRWDGSAWVQA